MSGVGPVADIDALVAPVAGAGPAGADLRYLPIFDEIRTARRDAEVDPRELPPWRRVVDLLVGAMGKSRDLQLVVWFTEALSRLEGFQGAAGGLQVLHRTVEQFWDSLYPAVDPEDSDPLEHRRALLEWLDDRLPEIIKSAPIVGPPLLFGLIHYEVTQKTGAERQALVDEGWPTLERFQGALQATAPARLEAVLAQILACDAELTALQAAVDQRINQAPGSASGPLKFTNLRQTIDTARWLVERVVKKSDPAGAAAADGAAAPAGGDPARNGDQLWTEALTLTRDSKVDGLRLVQTHLAGATSGRDLFLRQLQLAELSLEAGVYSLAYPVFDELARIVDSRRLEEWEDTALMARVFRGLSRCCGLLKVQNPSFAARETEMSDRASRLGGSTPPGSS